MTNYFKDCANQQDAKTIFRRLAKSLHPDMGGSDEEMSQLKEQYDAFKPDVEKDTLSEKYKKTYSYYDGGHSGSFGNGFNDFNKQFQDRMNNNPYGRQSIHGIPFDHPIHKVMDDLKDTIRNLENKNHLERSLYEGNIKKIVKLQAEVDALNWEIYEKNVLIEKLNDLLKERKEEIHPKESKDIWWRRFFG